MDSPLVRRDRVRLRAFRRNHAALVRSQGLSAQAIRESAINYVDAQKPRLIFVSFVVLIVIVEGDLCWWFIFVSLARGLEKRKMWVTSSMRNL